MWLGVGLRLVFVCQMMGNEEIPSEGRTNGWQEISGNSGLNNVPDGPRRKASADEIGIGMDSQKDDSRFAARILQSVGSLDAIENGHRNVGDDDVRLHLQ